MACCKCCHKWLSTQKGPATVALLILEIWPACVQGVGEGLLRHDHSDKEVQRPFWVWNLGSEDFPWVTNFVVTYFRWKIFVMTFLGVLSFWSLTIIIVSDQNKWNETDTIIHVSVSFTDISEGRKLHANDKESSCFSALFIRGHVLDTITEKIVILGSCSQPPDFLGLVNW